MPDPTAGEVYTRSLYAACRFRRESEQAEQRRLKAFEQLQRVAVRSAVVRTYLQGWEHGLYVSWDAMLLDLALVLADQNERLLEHVSDRLMNSATPLIVETPNGTSEGPVTG